jgi:hypothetical protein
MMCVNVRLNYSSQSRGSNKNLSPHTLWREISNPYLILIEQLSQFSHSTLSRSIVAKYYYTILFNSELGNIYTLEAFWRFVTMVCCWNDKLSGHYPSSNLYKRHTTFQTWVCLRPEIGTSSVYWSQQSRCPFYLLTDTSLQSPKRRIFYQG